MPLIYIIEDDEDIQELLKYNLSKEGYKVRSFYNGKEPLEKIKFDNPDLVILDIMLPDLDGLEFCKKVKTDPLTEHIPIIMLTAKSTEIDKVVGLELGADDYITKPFSIRELLARIKAVLRRYSQIDKKDIPIIKEGDLEINKEKLEVKLRGEPVKLTTKEYRILLALINSKNKALSRDQILDFVWEDNMDVFDRTIDVHINKLRLKLQDYGKYIKTVRGYGYMWERES
ncbi:MAG: DNA-binding response regulator [Persephonella sp.]|nr:MAG: DNA-binding response regulator [Persephonella sp.]RUM61849.1 MAG: DNA-binding response regulator [Persephonella sp.]